jgi:hypothetical protein
VKCNEIGFFKDSAEINKKEKDKNMGTVVKPSFTVSYHRLL